MTVSETCSLKLSQTHAGRLIRYRGGLLNRWEVLYDTKCHDDACIGTIIEILPVSHAPFAWINSSNALTAQLCVKQVYSSMLPKTCWSTTKNDCK